MMKKKTATLSFDYIETVHRLSLAAEFKDKESGAHIRRISYYTRELALELGLSKKFAERIFYAAPMHDVGKVGIPDSILLKSGPLSEDEWKIMRLHPYIGVKILRGSESAVLKMAEEIAYFHHELWDGSGYPLGYEGDKIPMSARIMSIADQYDALRSERPFKKAFDHDKTVEILTKGDKRTSPDHFDPEVLNGFDRVVARFQEIFETYQTEKEPS
ncbi:MAG: HD domain-containing protein [Desulfobulbaceae bacterium]|nr:HD domain-containing protein [Desulfobulbaceae bacterium]